MVNGEHIVRHGSVLYFQYRLILSTGGVGDDDSVVQDGHSLQCGGRTPGDKQSSGVDSHSEVSD